MKLQLWPFGILDLLDFSSFIFLGYETFFLLFEKLLGLPLNTKTACLSQRKTRPKSSSVVINWPLYL